MTQRRAAGALESDVMATLWGCPVALTAGEVQDALGADLAYNTVQTILTRLLEKGLVEREKVGRAHAYRPVPEQAELAAERMRELLEHGHDHNAVLQRFVTGLSATDTRALRRVLGRGERR